MLSDFRKNLLAEVILTFPITFKNNNLLLEIVENEPLMEVM